MKARKLNETGIHEFEGFVRQLRSGVEQNTPTYLLTEAEYSEPVDLDVDFDTSVEFGSRYAMGEYLVALFKNHSIQSVIGDRGFWSWIALLWFEQLCPTKNGVRKPSQSYNYVLSPKYNHRPRHAVYMTWQLVDRYAEDVRFMLSKLTARGEIIEQMMARQEFLSSEGAVRLASYLYFDPQSGGFKKGSAARKSAGCIARYIAWLQQLQLTFDIFSTTNRELKQLLPAEFDRFLGVAE